MANRVKRTVKKRSRAHRVHTAAKRRRRVARSSKVGYGMSKRRAKKARASKRGASKK